MLSSEEFSKSEFEKKYQEYNRKSGYEKLISFKQAFISLEIVNPGDYTKLADKSYQQDRPENSIARERSTVGGFIPSELFIHPSNELLSADEFANQMFKSYLNDHVILEHEEYEEGANAEAEQQNEHLLFLPPSYRKQYEFAFLKNGYNYFSEKLKNLLAKNNQTQESKIRFLNYFVEFIDIFATQNKETTRLETMQTLKEVFEVDLDPNLNILFSIYFSEFHCCFESQLEKTDEFSGSISTLYNELKKVYIDLEDKLKFESLFIKFIYKYPSAAYAIMSGSEINIQQIFKQIYERVTEEEFIQELKEGPDKVADLKIIFYGLTDILEQTRFDFRPIIGPFLGQAGEQFLFDDKLYEQGPVKYMGGKLQEILDQLK